MKETDRAIPFEEETEFAKRLHAVYRKYAGNMGLGGHLPETWNAVAAAALSRAISHPDPQDSQSLAEAAADHLERYRRAPWKGIDDPERLGHLQQAIQYLKQAQELERE